MALDLTGKLSEVFARIGNDISDLINKIQTNTDIIATFENKTVNLENQINDLINFLPSSIPATSLDGAVLISKLEGDKIIYRWESLINIPMNAEVVNDSTDDSNQPILPNLTIENVYNGIYNINNGELIYTGGTLPLLYSVPGNTPREIEGTYVTLNLPTNDEEEFVINTQRVKNDSYHLRIFLSNNPSAMDVYKDENLQSIMLYDLINESYLYSVRNTAYDNGYIIDTTKSTSTISIKNNQLIIVKEDGSRSVFETSDDIKYLHFIVTNELEKFLPDDINIMKLSVPMGE